MTQSKAPTAANAPKFPAPMPKSGHPHVDAYLETGYASVVGMSSHFAAAITARLMRLQSDLAQRAARFGTAPELVRLAERDNEFRLDAEPPNDLQ